MKTKIFTLLFAVLACVQLLAYDAKIGALYYNLDSFNQTAEVTSQNSTSPYWSTTIKTANIPSTVKYNNVTYNVTSIGMSAFYGCTSLTSVTIPNSVTRISDFAFEGCTGLKSVTIPNSVTSIGVQAFSGCAGLTSVTIPNSVTSIGEQAFRTCTGLTSVTIPDSVTYIGRLAFEGCTGLTSPVYNAHVFAYMPTSYSGAYTIPDGIELIAGGACWHCSGLTSVTIPNSVTYINSMAFSGCTGLTSVTIPNSVRSIFPEAFYNCTSLTSLTLPNSVRLIQEKAFYNCTSLTSVTIGNSVTSIESMAFSGCTGLTAVTCEAMNPPTLGSSVFSDVIKSIPLYVPAGSITAYKAATQWKDFKNILPISAQEAETTGVETTTTENSVEIKWPAVEGAATYELIIKDEEGNVICTLVFNAQGQLISITFNAPSRNEVSQQTQGVGFAFTITGLTKGTSYNVTITAKDSGANTLDIKIASFTTEEETPTCINDINAATKSQKILHDGKILILRGDKTYTLTGQEVR